MTILSIDQSESCRDLKSVVGKKSEVVMCRNSDISIPTLFHYFLQHPFLYTLVIFMKFFHAKNSAICPFVILENVLK